MNFNLNMHRLTRGSSVSIKTIYIKIKSRQNWFLFCLPLIFIRLITYDYLTDYFNVAVCENDGINSSRNGSEVD